MGKFLLNIFGYCTQSIFCETVDNERIREKNSKHINVRFFSLFLVSFIKNSPEKKTKSSNQ